MKIGLALIIALFASGAAAQQQRTFYDAGGKVVGRAATDSQGATTFYDAAGRVVGRTATSGSTTNVYDARGRHIGNTNTR
jgi:YD repeat-containing protein